MAYDYQNFDWTIGSNSSRNLPDVMVELQVIDSETGEVLRDFTGANAFNIWTVFGNLPASDKKDVLADLVMSIIRKRAS